MTLMMVTVEGHTVIQVSDRRLTRRGLAGPQDEQANKSVVVACHRGYFTIGYTGAAYLDGHPTDDVIAAAVKDDPEVWTSPVAETFPPLTPSNGHMGPIIHRVSQRIMSSLGNYRDRHSVTLLVAGYHVRRAAIVPFVWTVLITKDGVETYRDPSVRTITEQGKAKFVAVGSGMLEAKRLLDARYRSHPPTTPDQLKATLCGVVQSVSDVDSSVGPDAMTVMISPFQSREVVTQFVPRATGGLLPGFLLDRYEPIPEVYTPWVIGPGGAMGPQHVHGGVQVVSVGGISQRVLPPPGVLLPSTPGGGMQAQRRRGPLGQLPGS